MHLIHVRACCGGRGVVIFRLAHEISRTLLTMLSSLLLGSGTALASILKPGTLRWPKGGLALRGAQRAQHVWHVWRTGTDLPAAQPSLVMARIELML